MLTYVLAYLGGVLTILSPCILPVLPFVFSRAQGSFLRNGLPLLAGMALTFAGVSTLAAVGGGWAVRANEWGRWIALAILAVFALCLLIPALADRMSRPLVALGSRLSERSAAGSGGIGQSLLLGVATGLLWAPCAGPILGLILTFSALGGPSLSSTVLLLAYALGAATSLAVVLAAGSRVISAFKRSQAAEEWIRRIIGVAVLVGVVAVALGLDRGVLARLSGPQTTKVEQGLIDKLTPSTRHPEPSDELKTPKPLPDLALGGPWLNGGPLTNAGLKGKVVLIDFWTYSCINCLRSLPYVEAWAKQYGPQGLVVIGIHTPEFAFEKNQANVEKAIKDFAIPYPVVMDNDRKLWTAFDNGSWPAHYFVDAKGMIRAEHDGEGGYDMSEAFIRKLLAERNGRAVQGGTVQVKGQGVEFAPDFENALSMERYLGYAKMDNFASGAVAKDMPRTYALPASYMPDAMGFAGTWTVGAEHATAGTAGAKIAFLFHARDLNMVLGPSKPGQTIRFRVTVDGKPPGAGHGVDVDADGRGVVTAQRLYQLVRQTKVSDKDLLFQIEFDGPGVQAYSFTFG